MCLPSHNGVDGNVWVDLLAKIGAALDTMGQPPGPFMTESAIKRKSKELPSKLLQIAGPYPKKTPQPKHYKASQRYYK